MPKMMMIETKMRRMRYAVKALQNPSLNLTGPVDAGPHLWAGPRIFTGSVTAGYFVKYQKFGSRTYCEAEENDAFGPESDFFQA